MSGREWQPGDVAMVTWDQGRFGGRDVAIKTTDGWHAAFELHHDDVTSARPLVVIDPEDREQVVTLLLSYYSSWTDQSPESIDLQVDAIPAMTDALRELLSPPKPPEPQGLGAVIEDDSGAVWIRTEPEPASCTPWTPSWTKAGRDLQPREYADIHVTAVLSEGVAS